MATESLEIPTRRKRLRSVFRHILQNRKAVAGLALLIPLIGMSVFAPWITPHDPTVTDPVNSLQGPSSEYLFGTDHVGRDLLSRVMLGGRISIALGVSAVTLALVLGVPTGLSAGYLGGDVDEFLMRAMDVLMSFPSLLLALLLIVALGAGVANAALAIGIVYAPRVARVVRSSTLSVKNEEFVMAAEARGESNLYVMFKEILPNVLAPIVVEGSIRVGFAILIGASLSFLGLGAQPPTPAWGVMIAESRSYIYQTPYYLLWPSLALGLTVMGFNLLGDGLRDALDTEDFTE